MTLHLENRLLKRAKLGNLRTLKTTHPKIDFSSNDYLGLARSPLLAAAVFQEWQMHFSDLNGLGSTGSRLLTGNSLYAQALEEKIAKFHGYEAGLLFSCGYMANVGLLSAVASQDSVIFYDAAVHASTHDGIRLSRAKAFAFRHNDLEHLENRLKTNIPRVIQKLEFGKAGAQNLSQAIAGARAAPVLTQGRLPSRPQSLGCRHSQNQLSNHEGYISSGNRFICVESIYSTDGSIAPLTEISRLAREHDAHLIVDEAHAVGVYGPNGRGLVAEHHLMNHVFAQVTTFGKGLGTYGAIILGNHTLKQALINFATSYIYTTALPFQTLAAINCSYDLFPKMDRERIHLQRLIQIFRKSYLTPSPTHIQLVLIKGNEIVKQAAQSLGKKGFDIRPLMSPTIQRGREVLRICLHAFNTESEITQLIHHLQVHRSALYA